jgi:hypothetical protein
VWLEAGPSARDAAPLLAQVPGGPKHRLYGHVAMFAARAAETEWDIWPNTFGQFVPGRRTRA